MTSLRVVEWFQASDTGRERRANEDAAFAHPPLFAVADGMGGAQAGEVASQMAVEALEPGGPLDGPLEAALAHLAEEANRRIYQLSRAEARRAGMGTTLTMAYAGEHDFTVAHVGDSRAYLLRDGRLTRLTRDHSLVAELVERGKITQQQAEEHPQRSIITRALGPEPRVQVDTRTHPAQPGDVVLLCSDGLTSMVPETRMVDVLAAASSLEDAGLRLIDAANAAGGRDNITVVLFRVDQTKGRADDEGDQPTQVAEGAPSTAAVAAAVRAEEEKAARRPPTAGPVATAPRRRRAAPLPASRPPPAPPPRRRRRRLPAGLVASVVLIVPLLIGAWMASRAVYFVGTDDSGAVAIFRGLPYEGPAGIELYEHFYSSGVTAASLPSQQRRTLLDHELRSRDDAEDLVRRLERGELRP